MHAPYIIGIDFGTESVRVGVFNQIGEPIAFASQTYPLTHPYPGWAEQKPEEWWSALVTATRAAVDKSGVPKDEIVGLGADCTSCTVVAMDENFQPLPELVQKRKKMKKLKKMKKIPKPAKIHSI